MRAASTRVGARRLLPTATACGCRWVWFQRLLSGAYSPLGCGRHSSAGSDWSQRCQRFHVKPEEAPNASTQAPQDGAGE